MTYNHGVKQLWIYIGRALFLPATVLMAGGASTVVSAASSPVSGEKTVVVSSTEKSATATETRPAGAAKFDLDALVERLKQSDAIGILTKLAIRSDVLDFRDRATRYRQRQDLQQHLGVLRDRFNGLLLKIMALLEDDPTLAKAIYGAREQIWQSLVEVKA